MWLALILNAWKTNTGLEVSAEMNAATLRTAVVSLETNTDFSEAVLLLRDNSRLCFCHRVGQRWAKAVGPSGAETDGGLAEVVLADIALFRLNGKHLEIQFEDGSCWEKPFRGHANK
jgi:hypothetical protein